MLRFISYLVVQKKIESEIPTDTVDKMKGQFESAAQKIKAESENLKKHEYVRKSLEGISKAGEQIADVSRSLGSTEFVKSAKEVGWNISTCYW